jgi:hypothetical protein
MSFIWTNSTKSGLCDRLIDLFIITSYAQLCKKKLYLTWEIQPINDIQKKIWNPLRFDDYKIENVKQYFQFSKCIHFLSNEELQFKINNRSEYDILFNFYLGGIYSPFTFYIHFNLQKNYKLEEYINIFQKLIHQFQPTQKLLNLVSNIPTNLITVHLRRTDKSSKYVSASAAHGIDLKDIDDLNNKTKNLIGRFIEKGFHHFYFASDCPNTKHEYEQYYQNQNQNIINYKINQNIEQTYIDIYLMSQSKYIILSQRHSSFSLFSSMINQTQFIFFYEDSIVNNNKYTNLNHICNINNLNI